MPSYPRTPRSLHSPSRLPLGMRLGLPLGLGLGLGLALALGGCGEGAGADSAETGETGSTTGEPTLPTWPEAESQTPHDTAPMLDEDQQLIFRAAQYDLAVDLFHELRGEEFAAQNFVLSTPTLRVAMGMLWEAILSPGYEEAQSTFHYDLGSPLTHVAHNWWDAQLNALNLPAGVGNDGAPVDPVIVVPANSVWVAAGLDAQLPQPFVDNLAQHYDVGLKLAEFSTNWEVEREKINSWVEASTRGLVVDFFDEGQITDLTTVVLVNTLYVKAPWQIGFEPTATMPRPFQLDASTSADVPTMVSPILHARFVEAADHTAVALPLRGNQLELVVMMPTLDYAAYEAELSTTQLQDLVSSLEYGDVLVTMPKFTVDSKVALRRALESLGFTWAWIPNFSAMSFGGGIAHVIHQAVIEVDENGIEAAAASGVVVEGEGSGEPEYTIINLDRPFVFMLRDVPTGSPLFLGRVLDPRL